MLFYSWISGNRDIKIYTFLTCTCARHVRVEDHVSSTISGYALILHVIRVYSILQVGSFPVDSVARGFIKSTFVIDVCVA